MNQFDRQRLKEKKIERDIRRSRLGTRQDCCRDCSRLSSITVLVDVPSKRTALHFPNWFSFEMTNGSTANSSLGLTHLGHRSLRVSGASLKLGREAGS